MNRSQNSIRPKEIVKIAICCVQDLKDYAQMRGEIDCAHGFNKVIELILAVSSSLKSASAERTNGGAPSDD